MTKQLDLHISREDLVEKIKAYEAEAPDRYLLRRKKTGEPLPVNTRRIQQFCDEGIIPKATGLKGEESLRGRFFSDAHLISYLAAIRLRKSGQPVSNLAGLLAGKTLKELEVIAFENFDAGKSQSGSTHIAKIETANQLRRLGRREGRALKSTLTRYAITPDIHVTVNNKIFKQLDVNSIDAVTEAFKEALLSEIQSK